MIPKKDYYVDAADKLTTDPSKYAAQVAVAGVNLDERTAQRYGISDELVSVDEPAAVRKVIGKTEESKSEETEPETEPATEPEEAAEAAEDAEPKAEEPKAEKPKALSVKKSAAKPKGAKIK